MDKSYPAIAKDLSGAIRTLRKAIPDTMAAFSGLAKSALEDSALDPKTKELLAVAIAITTRCDGCIAFHTKALVELGATREEVAEVIGMSVYMGGGPSMIYGAQTLESFDQFAADAGLQKTA